MYNFLEKYYESIPHIVDYDDEVWTLVPASMMMLLGLKLCELCGNWRLERSITRSMEVTVFGISLYGSACGLGIPNIGVLWQYVVGLQTALLVFNAGSWLDSGHRDAQTSARFEKEEKEGNQV